VSLPVLDLVALGVLLVFLPVVAVVQLRFLGDVEIERMPAYVTSIFTLAGLGGVAWLVGTRDGGATAMVGAISPAALAAWTAGLVLAGLAVVVAFRQLALGLGLRESPILRDLMPRTGRERAVFAVLSLCAGIAEETAYRGYALTTLAAVTGVGWAAVVTSLVFGVLHTYQGGLGMARTATLGGVLAWGYVASGSLWAPVAAHVLLDIILGLALADRLMVPEDPIGVPAGTFTSSGSAEHGS